MLPVIRRLFAAPFTSARDPRLVVPAVIPGIAEVPLSVIEPLARGVPRVGRTRRLDHTSWQALLPDDTRVTVTERLVVLGVMLPT